MKETIERASARHKRSLTLNFNITGQEVLVDRLEPVLAPHSLIAKIQIENLIGALAKSLRAKGENELEVERVMKNLLSERSFDLASLCDFLDTAYMFTEKIDHPVEWIERISRHVIASAPSHFGRSMRTYQLFEEVKNVQGTGNESILAHSIEP